MNNKFYKGLFIVMGSHIFLSHESTKSMAVVKLQEVSFQKKFIMKMSSTTQHYLHKKKLKI